MPSPDEPCPVKNLDSLLQQTLGLQLLIQNVTWKPLTGPGENFGSLIIAVDAIGIRDHHPVILNLVIKLPPPSEYLLDLFNSPLTFGKEITFYRKIAPAFLELQLESGIKRDQLIRLVPRFYGGRLGLKDSNKFDNQAAIALENLNSNGYTVQDRLQGLDKEHTELAVKELAKLHALTIGLKLKKPEVFQRIVMPALVHPANDTARNCVMDMVRAAHNQYRNLPEAAPYLDRINKVLEYDYELDYRTIKPSEPWGTMVHNDFWVNNIMFQHNEKKKPIDLKIVDFQLGFYDSGVKDLVFFLLTSTRKEILDNNLDDMIELYYRSFISCLVSLKINVKDFSKEKFYEELNTSAPLKFGQCIMMIKIINAPRGSVPEMDGLASTDSLVNIEEGKQHQEKLMHTLQIFDKKGWLAQ